MQDTAAGLSPLPAGAPRRARGGGGPRAAGLRPPAQAPHGGQYEKFRSSHPDSALLAEIRPKIEAPLFERARIRGTVAAYREFLEEFPDGRNAERAEGNLEYLENGGFGGHPAELAAFATRHPASDFASEADRSAASVEIRRQSAFRSVGVLIEVAPETPGGERVARAFAERVRRHLHSAGVELVALSGPEDPRGAGSKRDPDHPTPARASRSRTLSGGTRASAASSRSRTSPSRGRATPNRSGPRSSPTRSASPSASDDTSILFGATGEPLLGRVLPSDRHLEHARWRCASRSPSRGRAVAVDVIDHRAVVLFEDGGFRGRRSERSRALRRSSASTAVRGTSPSGAVCASSTAAS